MGPIEVLYCWQSILCALTAGGATQLVKTVVDIWWGHVAPAATPTVKDKLNTGRDLRQRTIVVNRLVLPMVPVLVGSIYAIVVPARPDTLTAYVAAHVAGWTGYLIYAAWGAACGQFSDYIVSKVKDLVAARVHQMGNGGGGAPPPAQPEDQGGMGGG